MTISLLKIVSTFIYALLISDTLAGTTENPTTEPATTDIDTTIVPTTESPTTEDPTTIVPTTERQTTIGPTTESPTTEVPTTIPPTTEVPTTIPPTTEVPTTEPPTTEVPTTIPPTAEVPTTIPPTTEVPTTEMPTTEGETTEFETTVVVTTVEPTTVILECPPPLGVANAFTAPIRGPFYPYDIIRYICKEGFTITGTATQVCGYDQQWHGDLPYCTHVDTLELLANEQSGKITIDLSKGDATASTVILVLFFVFFALLIAVGLIVLACRLHKRNNGYRSLKNDAEIQKPSVITRMKKVVKRNDNQVQLIPQDSTRVQYHDPQPGPSDNAQRFHDVVGRILYNSKRNQKAKDFGTR